MLSDGHDASRCHIGVNSRPQSRLEHKSIDSKAANIFSDRRRGEAEVRYFGVC
jgi:hypothetical protein